MSNPRHSTRWVNGVDTPGTYSKPEKPLPDKLTLTNEQVNTLRLAVPVLRELLDQLQGKTQKLSKYTFEDLAPLLYHDCGIRWDRAIAALEYDEPMGIKDFSWHYCKKSYDECRAFCRTVDVDLLASLLAYEARYWSHWANGYDSGIEPFFIAGLECLIEAHTL